MEPVDHRTTGTDVESELELRQGPPYGESNILWTGGKRSAIKTETVRRELEESFSSTGRVSEPVESPSDARAMMEHQWEAVAASTSGRGPVSGRNRCRRRSDGKVSEDGSAARGIRVFGRRRRQSMKGLGSAERRMAILIRLETLLQRVVYSRDKTRRDTTVGMFLRSHAYLPLLTRTEEGVLSYFVHEGRKLETAKRDLEEKLQREATSQELSDACGMRPEDMDTVLSCRNRAKHLLVQYNLRMVVSIAQPFRDKVDDLPDLLAEGTRGLERAAELFDFKRGHKFSTYAYYWVRQAMTRCISNESRVIRLPVHVCEALAKIKRVTRELRSKGPVTNAEIADAVGISEEKLELYKKVDVPTKSLDVPLFATYNKQMEQDVSLLVDNLVADAPPAEDVLKDSLLKENLNVVLNTLHPRERNVLRMRYGLHAPDGESMKLCDISTAYGLSSERIRQIEEKALRKMRRPWRKSLLMVP